MQHPPEVEASQDATDAAASSGGYEGHMEATQRVDGLDEDDEEAERGQSAAAVPEGECLNA